MPALLSALLASSALAAGAPAPVTPAPPPALAQSTQTVGSLYTGDRVRDPFLPASSSGARAARKEEGGQPEASPSVDIHALTLRGMMKDSAADYALFAAETGEVFMLRAGRLFNDRNKPVQGITGRIRLKQKMVELFTPERDRQPFIIGESRDKEKDEEKRP